MKAQIALWLGMIVVAYFLPPQLFRLARFIGRFLNGR